MVTTIPRQSLCALVLFNSGENPRVDLEQSVWQARVLKRKAELEQQLQEERGKAAILTQEAACASFCVMTACFLRDVSLSHPYPSWKDEKDEKD